MFLDHTRHSTVGRTPLDEWSARRRDLYLTTHDTHNRQLITRPESSYRLCCVVVCDLETSRMGAPYIYDISRLRVNNFSSNHSSSPRKRCLFHVTWIALFLNQILYQSCCRSLMLSRRHLRVGRQTFTIFSVTPGSQQRGSYEGHCVSWATKQERRWYVRGYQCVYAQMFVNGNSSFQTSDELPGTYQQSVFVFRYVYSSVSLNSWTGWPVFYMKIQSAPRSKHSQSRLYKPVS